MTAAAERIVFAVLLATVPAACATRQVTTPRTIRTATRRVRRDDEWLVETSVPALDSALLAGIDTATTEGGWCLEADRDDAAGVLRIQSVVPAAIRYARADSTQFGCPAGAVPAHRHFLDRGHVDGPSSHDRATARRLRVPGVVVVVSKDRTAARYAAYGVPQN